MPSCPCPGRVLESSGVVWILGYFVGFGVLKSSGGAWVQERSRVVNVLGHFRVEKNSGAVCVMESSGKVGVVRVLRVVGECSSSTTGDLG